MSERLMTAREIGREVGLSRGEVLALARKDTIPSYRLSATAVRFRLPEVQHELRRRWRRPRHSPLMIGPESLPNGSESRDITLLSEVGFVYFLEAVGTNLVKIGCSTRHDCQRLIALNTQSPLPLHLRAYKPGGRREEARLHIVFRRDRIRFEWFDIGSKDIRAEMTGCRKSWGTPNGFRLTRRMKEAIS